MTCFYDNIITIAIGISMKTFSDILDSEAHSLIRQVLELRSRLFQLSILLSRNIPITVVGKDTFNQVFLKNCLEILTESEVTLFHIQDILSSYWIKGVFHILDQYLLGNDFGINWIQLSSLNCNLDVYYLLIFDLQFFLNLVNLIYILRSVVWLHFFSNETTTMKRKLLIKVFSLGFLILTVKNRIM